MKRWSLCLVWVFLLATSCDASDGVENDTATGSDTATGTDTLPDPDTGTQQDTTQEDTGQGGPVDCGFESGVVFDPSAPVLQLENTAEGVCVKLTRRDDSLPGIIYKAVPYTTLEMVVGYGGRVITVDDLAVMSYESSHHNWADVAEAVSSEGIFRLNLDYDGTKDILYRYTITGLTPATETLLWGPIEMVPAP